MSKKISPMAADGDHVDCWVGPHIKSPHVFVIDQIDPDTGKYDEPKCFLGFSGEGQVRRTYTAAFSDGKGNARIGKITGMTVSQFKDWLRHGYTDKPFSHVNARADRVREILKRHQIGPAL